MSVPLESNNYFPGLNEEYSFLAKLSKTYSSHKNKILIARLHPNYEFMYSKKVLSKLSEKGVLIWDKNNSKNFDIIPNKNFIKYTNCSSVFFESLGTDSVCIITSNALEYCRNFLDQPNPLIHSKLKTYIESWKYKSRQLKELLEKSSWHQNYFDPKASYGKEAINFIINSL